MTSSTNLQIMALTVWGEARGEPALGQRAVAWVILNRWKQPGWWCRNSGDGIQDDSLAAVCKHPKQFSCWNTNDANRKHLIDPVTLSLPEYKRILSICSEALLASGEDDPTDGAEYYCTISAMRKTAWAKERKPTVMIGNHAFYKLGLDGKG